MLNVEILSYLLILSIVILIPIFFYTAENKLILLCAYGLQGCVVLAILFQILFDHLFLSFIIWGIYVFLVCYFLELRRLGSVQMGWLRAFIIPIIAAIIGVLFSLLYGVFWLYIDKIVGFNAPWVSGFGFMCIGFVAYILALIVDIYYILAYNEYKVRYFVLSLFPYLLMSVFGIFFFDCDQGYYFLSTLILYVLAMVSSAWIKECWLGKVRWLNL